MNKHHLEEGHRIHHVGNVQAFCCECGCCHSTACEDFSRLVSQPGAMVNVWTG